MHCERNRLAIAVSVKDSVNGPRGSVNSAVRRFLEMLHFRTKQELSRQLSPGVFLAQLEAPDHVSSQEFLARLEGTDQDPN